MTLPPPPPESSPGASPERPSGTSAPPDQPDRPPLPTCPAFHPSDLSRHLARDTALRWAMVAGMPATLVLLAWNLMTPENAAFVFLFGAALTWLILSFHSARVWQRVAPLSALVGVDAAGVEAELAMAMRRRPLHRPVRLLLHHRLAVLRHRQDRFEEAGLIAEALLSRDLGAAERVRTQLMLVLAECRLTFDDVAGAYATLVALSGRSLNLSETVQHQALNLRYLVAAGYDDQAVGDLPTLLPVLELLPPAQLGMVHAMLAGAARRADRPALADWLDRRARLLCPADLLDQGLSHVPPIIA